MNALPILTIISFFIYYQIKNHSQFGVVSLLLFVYTLMAGSSILLELMQSQEDSLSFAFEAMVYLAFGLLIVFSGFTSFKDEHFLEIRIENLLLFHTIEYILIIGGFASMLFFLPFAYLALSGNIELNRIGFAALSEGMAKLGIMNSIFSLLANCFILSIIFAFINLATIKGKKNFIKVYLLLLSSLSFVVYILAYVGRDGIVYWVMTFIFVFFLFKNIISQNDKRNIYRIFIVIVPVILLIPFIMITYSRFSEKEGGVLMAIIVYAGMQISSFNDAYQVSAPLQYGHNAFPAIYDMLKFFGFEISDNLSKTNYQSYFLDEGVAPWQFKTFIGSLLIDFGKYGTLIFLLFMHLSTRAALMKVKRKGIFDFSNLIIFVLLYQTVYWGLFYNRLYVMNYYIIFMILLALLFKILRFGSQIVITRVVEKN
jgi:oligosaccharide repeat unit polymerase